MPLVSIDAGKWYLMEMQEMGPIVFTSEGRIARPDNDILSYFKGIGFPLTPWEFRLVRKMCKAFLQGVRTGHDKFGIMPMNRNR